MISRPFAVPREVTDKDLYRQRTDGTFINPPGYEHAHSVHEWGRDHHLFGSWDRSDREKRNGIQDKRMAEKGALK